MIMEGMVTYGKAEWRRTLQANYLNDFLLRMSIRKVFINFGAPISPFVQDILKS